MHSAPWTKTSSSVSGQAARISAISSSDSSLRQDHACDALAGPEAHGRRVDGIRLHRKVDGHLRPTLANQQDQTRVGHDQGVRTQCNDRLHVRDKGAQLGAVGHQVGRQIEALAPGMGLGDAALEIVGIEAIVPHPQAVAGQSGVDRVRAVGERVAQVAQATGGRQQLGTARPGPADQCSSTSKLKVSSAPIRRSRTTSTGSFWPG